MKAEHLRPGMAVMVYTGQISSELNDHPPVVCGAEVVGPDDTGSESRWWLDVWMGAPAPLPQSYRASEILGIPAVGLTWKRPEGEAS